MTILFFLLAAGDFSGNKAVTVVAGYEGIGLVSTSNMQTLPEIKSIKEHPAGKMNNRLVSHNNICKEFRMAVDNFAIPPNKLKDIVVYGFKRSFIYRPYQEKRRYVRKAINMFEKLMSEHMTKGI